jgi:hypothetical protein
LRLEGLPANCVATIVAPRSHFCRHCRCSNLFGIIGFGFLSPEMDEATQGDKSPLTRAKERHATVAAAVYQHGRIESVALYLPEAD